MALHVCSVGNLVGCAHVIPQMATSSNTGHGQNNQWIVHSHIDPATFQDVDNYESKDFILRAGRRNMKLDCLNVTHCIAIPMEAHTQ